MTARRKKDRSESQVGAECDIAWSENFAPGMLWRQNAGEVTTTTGHHVYLGPAGIADRVGFLPGGMIVFVELKKRTGKQRLAQINFQKLVEAQGCIYVVARSGQEMVEGINSALNQRERRRA